jgi:glyoxylase I family protein
VAVSISAIHHLGLTVSAVQASAAWYESVLGFERVAEYRSPDGARHKIFLRHPHLSVRLGLTQHRSRPADAFDETRAGLDHLAFGVGVGVGVGGGGEDELREWQARHARHGVRHSPIAAANSIPGASVLVFRDPDNIQLELCYDPVSR